MEFFSFASNILLQFSLKSSFTAVAQKSLIKITPSNTKIPKFVILSVSFFRYLSLRHLLQFLLTFAKKGRPERRSGAPRNSFVEPVYTLIARIPDYCPGYTLSAYKVPFTFLTVPCVLSHSLRVWTPKTQPLNSSIAKDLRNTIERIAPGVIDPLTCIGGETQWMCSKQIRISQVRRASMTVAYLHWIVLLRVITRMFEYYIKWILQHAVRNVKFHIH